ncbi:hypothetical protein E8E13_009378 [Curvularia kusanoi]|uniref:EKC/KEOPS complex subunit BUD32 n=1 Tax=Curvularia kusanoi TaxID=90978 RepID=A0A9P4TL97_CURKU|nr:hypothetical protein E8E13_009378 [Curvularia kusanoi]
MTKFTGQTDDNMVYMKGQAIMRDSRYNNTHFADCTQQEISRCERISASQHPNLARYLGVETKKIGDEDRVTRLAYRRYSMDLNEFVLMKRLLKARHVAFLMKGIESGMRHLHKLGLVHCDLRPMNVFVTFEKSRNKVVLKEVVIGDFDASVKIGEKVSLKRASNDWWPSDAKWGVKAEPWIDEWCLNKIGKWLEEDGLGIWEFNGQEDDTVVIGTNVAW